MARQYPNYSVERSFPTDIGRLFPIVGSAAIAVKDPLWTSVKLLLGADDINSITHIYDESSAAKNFVRVQSMIISNSHYFAGSGSTFCNTLRGGWGYIAGGDSDFNFQTNGNFTFEGFTLVDSGMLVVGNAFTLLCKRSSVNEIVMQLIPGGPTMSFAMWSSPAVTVLNISGTIPFIVNSFHHWAFVRTGNYCAAYWDGMVVATGTQSALPAYSSANSTMIGRNQVHPGSSDIVGFYDEIRFTRAARYTTSSFAPPTEKFPRQ